MSDCRGPVPGSGRVVSREAWISAFWSGWFSAKLAPPRRVRTRPEMTAEAEPDLTWLILSKP